MKSLFRLPLLGLAVFLCQSVPLRSAGNETREPMPFSAAVTGSGPAMILIPGLSCGGNVWDGTVEHFKDRYECHVITLAGFAGQTPVGEPFLEKVRDALVHYIHDKKLERPVIVGHSLGGFLALWIAATAPETAGPVIAVDGVPYYPALMNAQMDSKMAQPYAEGLRAQYQNQTPEQFAVENRNFLAQMITDPANLEKVAQMSSKSNPRAVGQAFYEMMTLDLRPKVSAVRSPVLLLGASASVSDPALKKSLEDNYRLQVAGIPGCKVLFAPKARHFIQLDEPDFLFREMESFLKEQPAVLKKNDSIQN